MSSKVFKWCPCGCGKKMMCKKIPRAYTYVYKCDVCDSVFKKVGKEYVLIKEL